ncbi:hypothetical protein GCM10028858_24860 [Halorubrum pallidum]
MGGTGRRDAPRKGRVAASANGGTHRDGDIHRDGGTHRDGDIHLDGGTHRDGDIHRDGDTHRDGRPYSLSDREFGVRFDHAVDLLGRAPVRGPL